MKDDSTATTVLSLRLAPDERRLIEEAAGQKGWKAAHFLRVSALEKAAHVLNLSRPTSFDFAGAAKRFAEVLVATRTVSVVDTEVNSEWGRFSEGPIDIVTGDNIPYASKVTLDVVRLDDFRPARLTRGQVEELSVAMRLGGAEFAAELVDECRRLALESDANDPLPSPIDPHNLKD